MKTVYSLAGAALAGALALSAPAMAQGSGSKTIDDIRGKGQLVCGVSTGVAGFSLADSKGVVQGIDADTCRAVAAAVLLVSGLAADLRAGVEAAAQAIDSGAVAALVTRLSEVA